MNIYVIILALLLILSLVITGVFAYKYFNEKKRRNALNNSISEFLKSGELTDFSIRDDDFSYLQNNVSELENKLMLEKSNTQAESKRNVDFVTDISHQLKTPLAGMRLYLEMERDNENLRYTDKELQLVDKMEKLVFSLLRLEKIKFSAYEMKFEMNSVSTVINNCFAEFKPLFPQKKFRLNGEADLRCDKEWLSEAIGNIIKNACEHTAEDGKIDVNIVDEEKSVSVTIEDNGGGVPEDQLMLLFKRFYRSENASPNSAGIGLSISRAIIERHHGTIFAENSKDGLKMSICIPKIDGAQTI